MTQGVLRNVAKTLLGMFELALSDSDNHELPHLQQTSDSKFVVRAVSTFHPAPKSMCQIHQMCRPRKRENVYEDLPLLLSTGLQSYMLEEPFTPAGPADTGSRNRCPDCILLCSPSDTPKLIVLCSSILSCKLGSRRDAGYLWRSQVPPRLARHQLKAFLLSARRACSV